MKTECSAAVSRTAGLKSAREREQRSSGHPNARNGLLRSVMHQSAFTRLLLLAVPLAFAVIVLGAWVRLSDAGLGCPDWPGCYGHLGVPTQADDIQFANAAYPERPVETDKAWKEMIHRYLAGALGLVVLALAVLAWRRRDQPDQPLVLPMLLAGLIVFQAMLGMWTVTLQLKPVVVMAHLLGGLSTIALLWWMLLGRWPPPAARPSGLRLWALLAFAAVIMQIALGGWTSTNYAALACTDFPTCHGQWWPKMDFAEGFVLWRGLGVNYEFGVLGSDARTAIHYTHRMGAMLVIAAVGWLVVKTMRRAHNNRLGMIAAGVGGLLIIQVALGIANVLMTLPLPVAVAHNGVAALLLLGVLTLNHLLWRPVAHDTGGAA